MDTLDDVDTDDDVDAELDVDTLEKKFVVCYNIIVWINLSRFAKYSFIAVCFDNFPIVSSSSKLFFVKKRFK